MFKLESENVDKTVNFNHLEKIRICFKINFKLFYQDIWSYTYTIRSKEDGQNVETREQIDKREYSVRFEHAS